MAFRTSSGDLFPTRSRYNAATPAVCGADIDVPDFVATPVSLACDVETIETPGANRSSTGPKLDHEALRSLASVAPTVIASDTRAGELRLASNPSLPAEIT